VWYRIDRFLVSSEWEALFSGVSQKRLPRLCSDHFRIFLGCGDVLRGTRPFKFENIWLKVESFVGLVK
jgi:hypothetical protein